MDPNRVVTDLRQHTEHSAHVAASNSPQQLRVPLLRSLGGATQRLLRCLRATSTIRRAHSMEALVDQANASLLDLVGGSVAAIYQVHTDTSGANGPMLELGGHCFVEARHLPFVGEALTQGETLLLSDAGAYQCPPGSPRVGLYRVAPSGTQDEQAEPLHFWGHTGKQWQSFYSRRLRRPGWEVLLARDAPAIASVLACGSFEPHEQRPHLAILLLSHEQQFSVEDRTVLQFLAVQIGAAAAALQMCEQHDAAVRQLECVFDAAVGMMQGPSAVVRAAEALLPVDGTLVLQHDPLTGALSPLASSRGLRLPAAAYEGLQRGPCARGAALCLVQGAPSTPAEHSTRLASLPAPSRWHARSLLVVPVFQHEGRSTVASSAGGAASKGGTPSVVSVAAYASGLRARAKRFCRKLASSVQHCAPPGGAGAADESGAVAPSSADGGATAGGAPAGGGSGGHTNALSQSEWRDIFLGAAHLAPAGKPSLQQELGVSALGSSRLLMLMLFVNRRGRTFTAADVWVAEHFALQAGLALSAQRLREGNAVLQDKADSVREQKQALLESAKLLGNNLSLDELFMHIMAHAKQLMHVDRSTLFLHDARRQELWSRVADGTPPIRIPQSAGIAGAVCMSRELINITDAYADPRFNPEVDRRTGYRTRTVTAYPILNSAGEMLGVLQLINRIGGEEFTEHDHELLQAFSAQVAMAIENCLVFERLMTSHSTIQKANEQITQLLAVNRELTREPNLRRMTAAVRRHALRLTRSHESEIFMVDHMRNQMVADSSLGTRYNIGWLRRGASAAPNDPVYLAAETAQTAAMTRRPADEALRQKALVCVALQSSRTHVVIGVLVVQRTIEYVDEDIETLQMLAAQAAVLLETNRMVLETQASLEEGQLAEGRYRALLSAGRSWGACTQVDLFALARHARSAVRCHRCCLYLVDHRQAVAQTFVDAEEATASGGTEGWKQLPLGRGLLGKVLREGALLNVRHAKSDESFDEEVDEAFGPVAGGCCYVPLLRGAFSPPGGTVAPKDVLGVLHVGQKYPLPEAIAARRKQQQEQPQQSDATAAAALADTGVAARHGDEDDESFDTADEEFLHVFAQQLSASLQIFNLVGKSNSQMEAAQQAAARARLKAQQRHEEQLREERNHLSTQLERFEARNGAQEVTTLLQAGSDATGSFSRRSGKPTSLPRDLIKGVDAEWANTASAIWGL